MNNSAKKVIIQYNGRLIRYICPKCKQSIQFKKKIHGNSLCMRCGQRLDWEPVHDISIEVIQAADVDDAAWIARQYYDINKMNEDDWFDIDTLRHTIRGDSIELYLLFFDPKKKGQFMRKYAKDNSANDG